MFRRRCKGTFKICALKVKGLTLSKVPASFIILSICLLCGSCSTTATKKTITKPLYSAEAYVKQGLLHYQNKEFEQASACFENAIEINRYYQPAHSYLAASLVHLGRKNESIQEFYKVIEIDPASTDGINAKKWLQRLASPTTVAVLTVQSLTKRASSLNDIATKEFIRILRNTKMYEVMDLSDVAYSPNPSSCELERLIEIAEKRGAQILILPRTVKFDASTLCPVDIERKGSKATIGVATEKASSHGLFSSGNLTMSITIYACKEKALIASIFRESSETFLFSSLNSAARSLYRSCSQKIIKELLRQVL